MRVGNLRIFGRSEKEVGARTYYRVSDSGKETVTQISILNHPVVNYSELAQPKGERHLELGLVWLSGWQ